MPDQKQLDHEKFTAEKIVSLCGEGALFERFGNPNQREPDIIFSGERVLGIEVTIAYYQGEDDDPNSTSQRLPLWSAHNWPSRLSRISLLTLSITESSHKRKTLSPFLQS